MALNQHGELWEILRQYLSAYGAFVKVPGLILRQNKDSEWKSEDSPDWSMWLW